MDSIENKGFSGIYKIWNIVDDRCYIGSAISFYNRYHTHKFNLLRGTHHSSHLQRFVDKYGFESLVFEIIEYTDRDRLIEREQYYIDGLAPAFNTARIAGNTLGVLHTPESKKKMSEARKGKRTSLGRKLSDDTKRKIGQSRIGKPLHPNFKAASIAANTGRKHSKEDRAKLAAIQSKVSRQDAREIWIASKLGVYQKDIARAFGISQRLVCRVLHGVGIYAEYKELDKDYFEAQEQRFADHIAQPTFWTPTPTQSVEQDALFA